MCQMHLPNITLVFLGYYIFKDPFGITFGKLFLVFKSG